MATLAFYKDDTTADRFPNEPTDLWISTSEEAQITYCDIRDQNDNTIATLKDGCWLRLEDGTHWSDIIING